MKASSRRRGDTLSLEQSAGVGPGKRARTEALAGSERSPAATESSGEPDAHVFYPEPPLADHGRDDEPGASYVDSMLAQSDAAAPQQGQSLSGGLRARMESSFNESFSDVRVHQGDGVARSMDARAVTKGSDIHFAAGAYQPGTASGDFLVGHELAHVVQQRRGGASTQAKSEHVQNHDDALEHEADRAGHAAARGERVAVHGAIGGAVAQCFGEQEHREMGDKATTLKGGARLYVTIGSLGYRLGYGELVAMGDYFQSIEQIERFASKRGPGKHTQEALEYVRWIKIGRPSFNADDSWKQDDDSETVRAQGEQDGRFEPAHYSEGTRAAVDSNYYKLATNNTPHFPDPSRADSERDAHERPDSAGASYRENHMIALRRAVLDGRAGKAADAALAAEAFGDHFLTDACSSGHIRMPRTDVTRWWDARDPGLFDKFRGYFVWRVTEWLVRNTNLGRLPDGGSFVMSQVDDAFRTAVGGKAELTMGILVSVALHDYDSEQGLHVLQEGQSRRIYGDGRLEDGDTKQVAVRAARLGAQEVLDAHRMGKQGMDPDEVIARSLDGGDQFAAERALPVLDPAYAERERMPVWAVESWEDLFADKLMAKALRRTILNKMYELESIADSQAEPARGGIYKGFIAAAKRDPIAELKAILTYGGGGEDAIRSRHPGADIGGLL